MQPIRPAFLLVTALSLGAAAIAEASSIEVPAVDPSQQVKIRAAQASRWTEGSYDVWHLTGGVRVEQGPTVAEAQLPETHAETPGVRRRRVSAHRWSGGA